LGGLLGVTVVVGLLRSPATGWLVAQGVSKQLGCEASVGGATVQFDGRLVIRDLVLRVPGLDGPAGEFLRARRVEVDLDWGALGRLASPGVTGVRMYEPLARVSVLRDGSGMSLAGIKAGAGGGRPPRIDAFGATVEFGEHDATGHYEVLRSIPVTGSLSPLSATGPVFGVKLQESQHPGQDRGLLLEGQLDLAGGASGPLLELRLHNLDLAKWTTDEVPTVLREAWSTLNMRGSVRLATLRFDGGALASTPGGDFRISMDLEDVAMNALVPSDRPDRPGAAEKPLALTDVNGSITFANSGITARLRGEVEDMPAQVVLTTEGVTRDAAVRCEIIIERFEVSKDPDLMPFAPPIVRENFARFSGPTAVVNARVVVTRGPGQNGQPGRVTSEGSISFENGAAAFDRFAYPIEQMRGLVRFDETQVELVNIRGRGKSGAIVSADGRIYPPRKGAEMLINVLVLDAPIDEYLLGAMNNDKREVVEKLFNRQAADELARLGLTATPKEHDDAVDGLRGIEIERAAVERVADGDEARAMLEALAQRAAELKAVEARPVFEFGGKVGMDLRVFSPLDRNEWEWSVDVRFPRAGVLASVFPLPMVLTDGLLRVSNDEAKLLSGTFTGLSGGRATVEAMVQFEGEDADPRVRVEAWDVPVDPLLLHAVAYDDDLGRAPDTPKENSAAGLLSRLALEGAVGCVAVIQPSDVPGREIDYDVTVQVDGLKARPANAAADGVALRDVRGRLEIKPGEFEVPGLSATMVRGGGDGGDGSPIGRLSIVLDQTSGAHGVVDAEVTVQDLDVEAPFESLVGVASPGAAGRIAGLRSQYHPAGVLDARVEYTEHTGGQRQASIVVEHPRGLGVDALGGRVNLSGVEGTIAATIDQASDDAEPALSASFDAVRADIAFDGEAGGAIAASGEVRVGAEGGPGTRELSVDLAGARVESGLTRALVQTLGGPSTLATLDEFGLRGGYRAHADVNSTSAGRSVRARIEPSDMALTLPGGAVEVAGMTGGITVERDAAMPAGSVRGEIDGVRGQVGLAAMGVNGQWAREPDGSAEVRLAIDAAAPTLDDGSLRLLPTRLRDAMRERRLTIDGPVSTRGARLTWQRPGPDAQARVAFAGEVAFENASIDAGVDVSRASGLVRIDFGDTAEGERWTLGVTAPTLVADGITLTSADAALEGGAGRGVRLTSLAADCHGGRLLAQAMTRPGPDANAPPSYDATVTLSGARFAGVIADLRRSGRTVEGPVAAGEADAHAQDESRGWIDATLSLSGVAGSAGSRLGSGAVRVSGGDVIRLPLVLPLLEVSNMALPAQASLDYADAAFRISGERVELTHAAILSDAIGLVGYGTVMLPDRGLDLKFNTLAATRIPLWSDVWEMVRNEIVGTAVRGTIDDPTFQPESLGGTLRLLGDVFGSRGPGSGFDPVRVDAAARAERARLKRAAVEPAGTAPSTPAPGSSLP
jgi:hypothetical protein